MTALEAMKLFNLVSIGSRPYQSFRGDPMKIDDKLIDESAYRSALSMLGEPIDLMAPVDDAGDRLPALVTGLENLGLGGLSRRRVIHERRGVVAYVYVATKAKPNGLALIGRASGVYASAWGAYVRLKTGIVVPLPLHQKAVAHVAALDVLSQQRSNAGRKAKYDWPLVVKMAVSEVARKYHDEEPLPSVAELSATVAERYLAETHNDLGDRNSDIRKYCAAVLNGLKD